MPITTSAKKALRQNIRHRKVNLAKKEELKGIIKSFKKLVVTAKDEAVKILSLVFQKLDKGAKTNLIKKNTASRLKSRLSKALARK